MSEAPAGSEPDASPDLGIALVRAVDQMRLHTQHLTEHAQRLTDYVAAIDARVAGTEAVAAVVDDNDDQVEVDRRLAAGKELISFIFEKSHQYVTVVAAGAYAAYFATLSVVSQRFTDNELRVSAALMTISVTVFALWEVLNVAYLGAASFRGDFEAMKGVPRWQRIGWPIALGISLLTAIPAIGLSLYTYLSALWPA